MTASTETLTFRALDYRLEVEPQTGVWTRLLWGEETLFAGAADFRVTLDGRDLTKTRLLTYEHCAVEGGERLVFQYELATDDERICVAAQTLDLFPDRLVRRLAVHATGAAPERLLAVTLHATGLLAARPDDARVSVPMARSLPALPLAAVAGREADFARDASGFALENAGLDTGMAAVALSCEGDAPWQLTILPLPPRCPVKGRVGGDGHGRLAVAHEFGCEASLDATSPCEGAAQVWRLARGADWQGALREAATTWTNAGYTPPPDRPAWARDAVIHETDLAFCGGFNGVAVRLDDLRAAGFDTLYLMPWHRGHWNGYGTYRYDEVNPEYGTFADLRRLCDRAHARGMRVIFDLLVNVAGEDSPYPQESPDWFYRDARGGIARHPTWNSWCLDPASPGFRRFLTRYAVRCCEEWGADGFRVDAAAYRGGNWNNLPGLQPHEHAHAVFTLLGEIRDAIRAVRPDAICMAECFGPVQVPISDLVAHQWVAWLDWANDAVLSGRLDGASLARALGEHFHLLPPGTWLVGYTHTHDTVAFEKRDLDGPAVAALFATLTLTCAAAMVFGGGWEMRARPAAGAETAEHAALFRCKAALGGVASDEVTFVADGRAALFVAERPSRLGRVRVVSNFGPAPLPLVGGGNRIYSRLDSPPGSILPFDTVAELATD